MIKKYLIITISIIVGFFALFFNSANFKAESNVEKKWEYLADNKYYYFFKYHLNGSYTLLPYDKNADIEYTVDGKKYQKTPDWIYDNGTLKNNRVEFENKLVQVNGYYKNQIEFSTWNWITGQKNVFFSKIYEINEFENESKKIHFRYSNLNHDLKPIAGETKIRVTNSNKVDVETVALIHVNIHGESNLTVNLDEYTKNWQKLGKYKYQFKLVDKLNHEYYHDLVAYVVDEYSPIIVGPEEVEVNVNQTFTDNQIISKYQAFSHLNNDISNKIIVKDKSSYIYNKIGKYDVTLEVDDNGFKFEYLIKINVVDREKPEIIGPNFLKIKSGPKQPMVHELMKQYKVIDNYDKNVELRSSVYEGDLQKGKIGYLHIIKKVGKNYQMYLFAEDSSGNKVEKWVNIEITHSNKPEIIGPKTIILGNDTNVSSKDILNLYLALDSEKTNISNKLSYVHDQFAGNSNSVGSYQNKISTEDSSGNITTLIIDIKVVRNLSNFLIADNTIYVAKNYKLDHIDIAKAMYLMYGIKYPKNVEYNISDYDENYNVANYENVFDYKCVIRGQEVLTSFSIKVLENEKLFNIRKNSDKKTISTVLGTVGGIAVVIGLGFLVYKISTKKRGGLR